MPRLPRPYIDLETRCRVALRQVGEMWPDDVINVHREHLGLGALLKRLLSQLRGLLGEERLHLDHDPPLGTRRKVYRRGVHVDYRPRSADPAHLVYRGKVAHGIKTNIRGEHGQHPDRVLIKKERRRAAKKTARSRPRNKSRNKNRQSWPSRPLRSRSRWPKGRRFSSRRKP